MKISAKPICLVACLAALCAASAAGAADYPVRPVRIIVGFPPGGTPDTLARAIGQKLGERWKHPVLVETRLGASGNIVNAAAAAAAPDGHTILLTPSNVATNMTLYKNLPYDTVRDLAAVTQLANSPHVLVVHPSLQASSVKELVALAKAGAGKLSFGSAGNGTMHHLAGEMFKTLTGVQMLHVPYKGSAFAVTDLVAGRLSLIFLDIASALPHMKSGKMRALAVTGGKQAPSLPGLPTIAQAGVPGYEIETWYGLFVPAATPREVVEQIYRDTAAAIGTPEFRARMLDLGLEMVGSTPAQFSAFVKLKIAQIAKVVKDSGTTVD